jgi:radical SAM superfamily enzyme YgiQ (UPF0313 family)
MKILLIYPNPSGYSRIPIGLSLLISCIKRSGHDVRLFDTTFFKLKERGDDQIRESLGQVKKTDLKSYGVMFKEATLADVKKDLLAKINDFNPDICGFSVNELMLNFSLELAEEIKKHFDTPILFGGVTVTVDPENIISKSFIDIICVGEGEKSIVGILDSMERKTDFSKIPNIWFKERGKIVKNEPGSLIDMNEIPFLDFDEFSDKHFYRPFDGKIYRMAMFEKKRGCPYRCSFCENSVLQDIYKGRGRYLRSKNTDRAIKELIFLKNKYKIEFFFFVDSDFCLEEEKELISFLREYKKMINLPFFIEARVDSVTREKLVELKNAGCQAIAMSIESGNSYIRQEILNKKTTNEKIIESFNLVREIGLRANSQNIIGLPEESRKEIFDTIELNRKARPHAVSANFLIPFRGTEIKKICVARGYINDSFIASDGIRERPVLKLPQISEEELVGLQRVFSLYVKLPKITYPLIRICENDNYFSSILYRFLLKLMWVGNR